VARALTANNTTDEFEDVAGVTTSTTASVHVDSAVQVLVVFPEDTASSSGGLSLVELLAAILVPTLALCAFCMFFVAWRRRDDDDDDDNKPQTVNGQVEPWPRRPMRRMRVAPQALNAPKPRRASRWTPV
jgi:hypothetical protein